MNRMIKRVFTILCLAGVCSVGPLAAQHKSSVDKVVANVGNSAILYSDVMEMVRNLEENYRQYNYSPQGDIFYEALEYLMRQKLMAQRARIDSVGLENLAGVFSMVDEQTRGMVAQAGSITALEAEMHMPIFDIKSNLASQYEDQMLAQSMQQHIISKIGITPGEVQTYYNRVPSDSLDMIPEQYVYAHITKYPPSTEEAKQRVRERLQGMREDIINGTSRFDVLARLYSMDTGNDGRGSASRGGEMDPAPKDAFVPAFAAVVEKLRTGQVSEVVETEYGFHIIEVLEKIGDNYRIRHILLRPTFTNAEMAVADRLLDSVAVEIRAGSMKFEEAAWAYSDDRYSKLNGGLVTNNEVLELMQRTDAGLTSFRFYKENIFFPADLRYLDAMQVGDVSDSFGSADLMGNPLSKIVKLIERIPSHRANINEDYLIIENRALEEKMEKEFNHWIAENISGMYIWIDPLYRDGQFQFEGWVK